MTEPNSTRKMGRSMFALMWVSVLVLLTLYFGNQEKREYNPNVNLENLGSQEQVEITLKRNRMNHYVATGKINGRKVLFLLDTGATTVAVPANLAEKLGLEKGVRSWVRTANGEVQTWQTQIASLELGPIQLFDVAGVINPGMSGNEILLGMSALKHLEFSQRDDELTIRFVP